MNKLSIALSAALLVAATSACQAQSEAANAPAPAAPVAAPAAAVPSQPTLLSNKVDTWIEGTVLTLDADGQKFTVRGVKLPFATAEAEMMADIADKTKDLDATQRQAKISEIQSKWADKLNKAKQQQVASSQSDFNFSLPDKANLVIMSESNPGSTAQDPNQVIASSSSASSSASVSTDGSVKSVEATAQVDPNLAKNSTRNELSALKSLKDLKIGDKVKVGFDAGLISNTAYVVLEGAPIAR